MADGAKSKRRRGSRANNSINGAGKEEDRLSSLPDPILVEILSSLPIKSAISTSILSRRWRYLWTQVTSVSISDHHFASNKYNMFTIIDGIRRCLTSPLIRKISLLFRRKISANRKPYFPLMDSWFRHVCDRNVLEIYVDYEYLCTEDNLVLPPPPPCIFRTPSLQVLDLRLMYGCHLPDYEDGAINLPNLRKLAIFSRNYNPLSLANLVNSCPVLEDLAVELGLSNASSLDHDDVHITCPNLKWLAMWFPDYLSSSTSIKVAVDVPKLEILKLFVFAKPLSFVFVKTPVGLLEAHFHGLAPRRKPLSMHISKSIYKVKCLQLSGFQLVYPPATFFLNLTHLSLKLESMSSKVDTQKQCKNLITFLSCCPLLEDITLRCELFDANQEVTFWNFSPQSESDDYAIAVCCELTHVKRMKVLIYLWDDVELEKVGLNLIKYLLVKAPVLKHLLIKFIHLNDDDCKVRAEKKRDESLLFCKELFKCPRSSSSCQIDFCTKYLRVSSKYSKF